MAMANCRRGKLQVQYLSGVSVSTLYYVVVVVAVCSGRFLET